jgi:hypothetical protein
MINKIIDKNITLDNYGAFIECVIRGDGKNIEFVMSGGTSYAVSLNYFLAWFKEPHYIYNSGRWIKPARTIKKTDRVRLQKFIKWRRIHAGRAVKVYLSDNTAYIVPWDTVLMACERSYEHFGGLTKESKKLARKYIG